MSLRTRIARRLADWTPLHRVLAAAPEQAWARAMVHGFIHGGAGAAYGVDAPRRAQLVRAFQRITRNVESGTPWLVHVALAEALLRVPREQPGVVVECGAWQGASSAALSLVCAAVDRRLVVCDSFAGLPDEGERRHVGLHTGVYGHYRAGMFAGTQEEVAANVAAYGAPDRVEYVPGLFADTLTTLAGPVAFGFLDVDLAGSTRDCLRALWPLLNEGACLYADDAGDLEVVQVYFDTAWWKAELGCAAPGFVGSGCGLPLRPGYSSLGYTRKLTRFNPAEWRRVPFLYYPDEA